MVSLQQLEIEYDCCGDRYQFEITLPIDGSLLHNASLADTAIMHCDRIHDRKHPECEEGR